MPPTTWSVPCLVLSWETLNLDFLVNCVYSIVSRDDIKHCPSVALAWQSPIIYIYIYIVKMRGNSMVSVIIVIVTNIIVNINIPNHPKSSPTQNLHKSEKATTCPRGRGREPPDSKAPIDTIAPSARPYRQLHLCNSWPVPGQMRCLEFSILTQWVSTKTWNN